MLKRVVVILSFFLLNQIHSLFAQYHVNEFYGEQQYVYKGVHDGNNIRVTFRNDGMIGTRCAGQCPDEINLEWPIHSGHVYMPRFIVIPMGEVVDNNGDTVHIASECRGDGGWSPNDAMRGDVRVDDTWRTMCALPGFVSPALEAAGNPIAYPAMSDNPSSWPAYWPDKMDDPVDPGWPGSWNGCFGKGLSDIDQESYFVADDYQNDEFDFTPDTTDTLRGGLGIRMACRGLQWKDNVVDDVLFFMYDMTNIGTGTLDKMAISWYMSEYLGNLIGQWCANPDRYAVFEKDKELLYYYDDDNLGCGGSQRWVENGVGVLGFTVLATPFKDNVQKKSMAKEITHQSHRTNSITNNMLGITALGRNDGTWTQYRLDDDSLLWVISKPGNFMDSSTPVITSDFNAFISCGYFSLDIHETARSAVAFIVQYGLTELLITKQNTEDFFKANISTSVKKDINSQTAARFNLKSNYPNPFNSGTQIAYELPVRDHVELSIYNMMGRKVRSLVNKEQSAGLHFITWTGDDDYGHTLASGIYVYQMRISNHVVSNKCLMLK